MCQTVKKQVKPGANTGNRTSIVDGENETGWQKNVFASYDSKLPRWTAPRRRYIFLVPFPTPENGEKRS